MKSKVLFIINPVSGGKRKDAVPGLIQRYIASDKYEHAIIYSTAVGHAAKLASEAVGHYDMLVAVGGDGTINEIASAIVGKNILLGIIPFGSGNGLSRFLDIPLDIVAAIKNINSGHAEIIDAALFNGQYFFNVAGMGFDAHISEVFSHDKERGFIGYVRSSFQEFKSFVPETYHIEIDGQVMERTAFMLSFANSSQFGNNAHIAPHASIQDGLLDVCVVKPFPVWKFPAMALHMFRKTAHQSPYVEIIQGKHIVVKRLSEGPVHLDGEPMIMGPEADIEIVPAALRLIAGINYKSH